ncbi:beta-1,3-galactosyltransferase 1 isoform X2 [Procambarus clarkii]|uniref:beta-1,3-galactosyltransferase 1 isoform X2 n=1 Tax=Procambarus clarkii TaxID=6728 RepID=UPI003743893C
MSKCSYAPPKYAYLDDDLEDQHMVNLRIGRTVQRSYIGRRSGCSQPVIVALFLISVFIFVFFQMANMIPRKPVSDAYEPSRHDRGKGSAHLNSIPPSFAWSSNATRDLKVYIRPDRPTALLQPTDFCDQPPFVLFVVPSAINNTKERATIRTTWGQWTVSNSLWELSTQGQVFHTSIGDKVKKSNIAAVQIKAPLKSKLIFLLGTARGKNLISNAIQEESIIFGDIVVEDFIDSYTNLTLKTVFILKWVHNNCPGAKFIMKVDDDIFVNVPNLHNYLLNKTTKAPLLTGNLICGARPIHDQWSKWYTPQYMFREGKYPNYLSGTGYVLSTNLVEPLLGAALSTPYFHLEDVFLTGICARKIGVHPKDNFGFSYQRRAVSPCVYKEVIMGHGVIPSEMIKLWNMLNQPNTLAKCHPIKKSKLRSHYPTKCS